MDEEQDWHLFDSDEVTTLAVPKAFAEKLRKEYKGSNDMARLMDWSSQDNYNNSITLPEIKSAVEDALQENLNEQALDQY